jgi:hypothetical protein
MFKWLRCFVSKGMFSDELAVKTVPLKGEEISVFVPRDQVEGGLDQEGKVKVRVFHQGHTAWAVLPTENRATIPVREADLVAS